MIDYKKQKVRIAKGDCVGFEAYCKSNGVQYQLEWSGICDNVYKLFIDENTDLFEFVMYAPCRIVILRKY